MSDIDSDIGTPSSQVRTPLLIGLGVLVLAALAYFFLLFLPNQGDGIDTVDDAQAPVGSEPAVVVPGEDAAGPVDDELPVAESTETAAEPSFEVFSARDPFDQLVADSEGGGAVGDTQDTIAPVDGVVVPPPVVPGDDPPDTTPDPSTGGPPQATVGTTTILLEEIFRENGVDIALVRIDNEGYEVAEGETVVGELTVLDIEDNCATMRFEDRRFILCEGEQVQK